MTHQMNPRPRATSLVMRRRRKSNREVLNRREVLVEHVDGGQWVTSRWGGLVAELDVKREQSSLRSSVRKNHLMDHLRSIGEH